MSWWLKSFILLTSFAFTCHNHSWSRLPFLAVVETIIDQQRALVLWQSAVGNYFHFLK